jgi:hypothetical protein
MQSHPGEFMPYRLISFVLFAIVFGSVSFARTMVVPITDTPITASQRLRWLIHANVSPAAMLSDVADGAEETLANSPKEYGPHWEGFGKRVGVAAGNYGVHSAMEAGLGAIWGEDPRYDRTEGGAFGSRLGHVVKMTFLARNRAGNTMPAYARFIAIPGGSFLANSWMPDSQATVGAAAVRTGMGFLGRLGENAFREFRPRH